MFFLGNWHHFHVYLLEIDFRKNHHLRLLQVHFGLGKDKSRKSHNAIRWFGSICESVTSKSLVVQLHGLINESELCDKIQDALLALYGRIETLSIFLSGDHGDFRGKIDLEDLRKLFSRLYEVGIVVEKLLDKDEAVGDYLLTSNLSY